MDTSLPRRGTSQNRGNVPMVPHPSPSLYTSRLRHPGLPVFHCSLIKNIMVDRLVTKKGKKDTFYYKKGHFYKFSQTWEDFLTLPQPLLALSSILLTVHWYEINFIIDNNNSLGRKQKPKMRFYVLSSIFSISFEFYFT